MKKTIKAWLESVLFPVYLAPMEGITDGAFRRMCKLKGADVLISEFISSDALSREVNKSIRKMEFEEMERPFGVQIFGHDEQSLISAAQLAERCAPDFIDINWGCPVKKVVNKGAGAAALQDVPRMIRLTEAVVRNVAIPVTVKTRLGWDYANKPIVEVAERLQDVGVQAVTIHGRTRAQMYGGEADWTLIGAVKANPRMTIPVIGNGDIDSPQKAVDYRDRYGVDAVMVGRSAIGNPWIFQQIKDYVQGKPVRVPSYEERVSTVMTQLEMAKVEKGERRAVCEMRSQYAGYFKGLYNFKPIRMRLIEAQTILECASILTSYQSEK